MIQKQELAAFSRRIYDGYGFSDVVGIRYFERFAAELARYSFREIVEHQLREYPSQYVSDFVMASPALWRNQPSAEWVEILTRKDGRPDPTKAIDEMGSYADIELLSRYFRVDALRFVVESAQVQGSQKANVLKYFRRFVHRLVPSELDREDMDGEYFATIQEVSTLRERLCLEQGLKVLGLSQDSTEKYIQEIKAISGVQGLGMKSNAAS